MSKKLNGLILAGGESTRMGSDKSLVDFHGKSQREYLFELLSDYCDEVFLSCNPSQQIPSKFNPLPDAFELKSPLNGILTAFTHNHGTAWLCLPVDMPNINARIIEHLLANRNPEKVATCYFDSEGQFPEPLFAVWEEKAYPLLMKYYEGGKYTPRGFLMSHDVNMLKSPDSKMHLNVNSPEELKAFQKGNGHSL